MNDGLHIRMAIINDLDEVASIFSRSRRTLTFLPELHTVAEDWEFWRDVVFKSCQIWVAHSGAHIAGVLALEGDWVAHLYVDPSLAGRGIGTALVKQAQNLRTQLQLWCFQDNRRARVFYERLGFVAAELTDGSGNEEDMPDVRYVWQLTE